MMRRHFVIVGGLWLISTVLVELLAFNVDLNPPGYAVEARVIDGAFRTMTILAVPVVTFVLATLAYSLWRFRATGNPVGNGPARDGPPLRGSGRLVASWLAVTAALCIALIINPGLTGMAELRHEHAPDLLVQVEGYRWGWRIQYPQYGVKSVSELVLPVGERILFQVTAADGDVIHSFWIPAFRVKIDAVPGLVTKTVATPTETGSLADDDGLRLQCAELCGLGHNVMRLPVRVVEPAEFASWVARQPTIH